MARPKISSAEKRSVKFSLQLTLSEKQQLSQLAEVCGKPTAKLAREKIFRGRFPEPKIALTDLRVYTELKKIGINLNQLTRKANAGVITVELLSTLYKLEQRLDIIIAKLVYDSQSKDR